MISGRLDEELARLSVIASHISQGCLILSTDIYYGIGGWLDEDDSAD